MSNDITPGGTELAQIYSARFAGKADYRTGVWKILVNYFNSRWPLNGVLLDLGAGYCEFINNAPGKTRYAMDLNPDIHNKVAPGVIPLEHDCSVAWPVPDNSLDVIFTSNFLEHLPSKAAVGTVLENAYRCLTPGGRFIAMGPNIRYLPGAYWDFFDHFVELTDLSLAEGLLNRHFEIEWKTARFLPYTMSQGKQPPLWTLQLYLKMPAVWPVFGKQFLVVARKPR